MRKQKGEILLALIVAMVVTAILSAGIVVITDSTNMSAAKSSNFTKALYLAEAGVRIGTNQPQGSKVTYTLSDSNQLINVSVLAGGSSVVSTGVVNPGTVYEARMTITRVTGGSGGNNPGNDTRENNQNVLNINAATFNNLSAFNLAGISNRVGIQAFLATGGSHVYWAALSGMATNRVEDSENPGCYIGFLFVPIAKTYVDVLRSSYSTYGSVSYEIQTKVGWDSPLRYAAQGINFRWHEHPNWPGKYQGYGVSFMIFNSRNQCSTSPDYIPNNIKPGPDPANPNSLSGRLLLVLWKQSVNTGSGAISRKWLAYAELGNPTGICKPPKIRRISDGQCVDPGLDTSADNDPLVTGWQDNNDGRVTDDASIGVRIDDVVWGTTHYNEIKVFYGDASPYARSTTSDAYATNTSRRKYAPQWVDGQYFTTWPTHYFENLSSSDNTLTYWSYSPWFASSSYTLTGFKGDPENVIPTTRTPRNHYTVHAAGTSGLTEPVWPTTAGTKFVDGSVEWETEDTKRPNETSGSLRVDYFTVLSANPQGLAAPDDTRVVWILNLAATEITLGSDNSTIKTYEFALDSFPTTRAELGLHGFVNSDARVIAFDDLSFIIMGKKE